MHQYQLLTSTSREGNAAPRPRTSAVTVGRIYSGSGNLWSSVMPAISGFITSVWGSAQVMQQPLTLSVLFAVMDTTWLILCSWSAIYIWQHYQSFLLTLIQLDSVILCQFLISYNIIYQSFLLTIDTTSLSYTLSIIDLIWQHYHLPLIQLDLYFVSILDSKLVIINSWQQSLLF